MTHHSSLTLHRHAGQLLVVYLLIRGLPDLLGTVYMALPISLMLSLMEGYGALIAWLLPYLPSPVTGVPFGFQRILAIVPVLALEGSLVFLLCLRYLKHRPLTPDNRPGMRHWLIMAGIILLWAWLVRQQVMSWFMSALHVWFVGDMPLQAMSEEQLLSDAVVFSQIWHTALGMVFVYASSWLWVIVPVRLHQRLLSKTVPFQAEVLAQWFTATTRRLQRGVVFSLGKLSVYYLLLLLLVLVVYPAQKSLPLMQMREQDMDFILGLYLVIVPLMAGALAAYLHTSFASRLPAERMLASDFRQGMFVQGLTVLCLSALLAWPLLSGILRLYGFFLMLLSSPVLMGQLLFVLSAVALLISCSLTYALCRYRARQS